jgi:hypothetical protein
MTRQSKDRRKEGPLGFAQGGGAFDMPPSEAVYVANTLYLRTPAAFEAMLARAGAAGYALQEPSRDDAGGAKGYMSLGDAVRKAVCGHCDATIPRAGAKAVAARCPECRKVIHWEIFEGSDLKLCFDKGEDKEFGGRELVDVTLRIFAYDEETGCLLVYPDVADDRLRAPGEDASQHAKDECARRQARAAAAWADPALGGQFSRVTRDREFDPETDSWRKVAAPVQAVAVPYPNRGDGRERNWSVTEAGRNGPRGRYDNVRFVCDFLGKRYGSDVFDRTALPAPDAFHLVKAYPELGYPLKRSPLLWRDVMRAGGSYDRLDFYIKRDGGYEPSEFTERNWKAMLDFVEHMTEVPREEFQETVARVSGMWGPRAFLEVAKALAPQGHQGQDPVIQWRYNGYGGDDGYTKATLADAEAAVAAAEGKLRKSEGRKRRLALDGYERVAVEDVVDDAGEPHAGF